MKKLREKSGTLKGYFFIPFELFAIGVKYKVYHVLWLVLFVSNHAKLIKFILNVFVPIRFLTEESEATSKQVLAKSEQIRKFQEENKHLGQLVSLVRFQNCFQFSTFHS